MLLTAPCWLSRALEDEDRRPGCLARFQVAMGMRRVLERVVLVDLDADSPCGHVAEELARELGALGRVRDVVGERRAREEERSLDGELHRIDGRKGAGGGAHTHQQSAA